MARAENTHAPEPSDQPARAAFVADLEQRDNAMDRHNADLMSAILRLEGPDAVPLAIQTRRVSTAFRIDKRSTHSTQERDALAR